MLFFDMRQAFDKVNHKKLREKMTKKGIDEKLKETYKWIYGEMRLKVGDERVKIG